MSIAFPQKATSDSVFVWIMHRMSEEFGDHAILKGGMALRLLDCPRSTNDVDYVFVPFDSKKDIEKGFDGILKDIPNAKIEKSMNSKAIRAKINVSGFPIQIEAAVSLECKSAAVSTTPLAAKAGMLGRVIKIMSVDVALSNKIAAWNERRLYRDIYDIYYMYERLGVRPDRDTLISRLEKVESRIPRRKSVKKMNIVELTKEIENALNGISGDGVRRELSMLLNETELAGLDLKFRAVMSKLREYLLSF